MQINWRSLSVTNFQASENHNALGYKRRKLDGLGTSLAPRNAIEMLANSQEESLVTIVLDALVVEAKLETSRKSLNSAAAGLRAWRFVAILVLL